MPIPIVTAAALTAGANILGQSANAYAQGRMNKKTREWNEKMYGIQRRDALSDWNMMNEYNSPESQMARFKEAGLNPNLIYGQGSEGNASMVRSSDSGSWSPHAPQFDVGGIVSQYFDVQSRQAQLDNMEAMNEVYKMEAILKSAQVGQVLASTESTGVGTERKKFDLELAGDLRQTSMEAARARVNKLLADTTYTLDENERRTAMMAPNLAIAAERILNMRMQREVDSSRKDLIRQQIENLKSNKTLMDLDINLKKMGIQPGDALWQRVLAQFLSSSGFDTMKEVGKGVHEVIKAGKTIGHGAANIFNIMGDK